MDTFREHSDFVPIEDLNVKGRRFEETDKFIGYLTSLFGYDDILDYLFNKYGEQFYEQPTKPKDTTNLMALVSYDLNVRSKRIEAIRKSPIGRNVWDNCQEMINANAQQVDMLHIVALRENEELAEQREHLSRQKYIG